MIFSAHMLSTCVMFNKGYVVEQKLYDFFNEWQENFNPMFSCYDIYRVRCPWLARLPTCMLAYLFLKFISIL